MQGWENHWQEWRLYFPPKVWTWGYFAAALERNRNSERSLSLWGSPPALLVCLTSSWEEHGTLGCAVLFPCCRKRFLAAEVGAVQTWPHVPVVTCEPTASDVTSGGATGSSCTRCMQPAPFRVACSPAGQLPPCLPAQPCCQLPCD